MKMKKWYGIVIAAILLFSAYIIEDTKITNSIKNEAEHIIFNNVEEAEKASDLVIEAIIEDKFKNVVETNDGFHSGYTLTNVKVNKILKNTAAETTIDKSLLVIEPYYLVDNRLMPGKTKITYEGYSTLKSGARYILFLKWNEKINAYWVNSLEQGKINIDGKDKEEQEVISKLPRLKDLAEGVKKRYE